MDWKKNYRSRELDPDESLEMFGRQLLIDQARSPLTSFANRKCDRSGVKRRFPSQNRVKSCKLNFFEALSQVFLLSLELCN
jgi:hypothetical protein